MSSSVHSNPWGAAPWHVRESLGSTNDVALTLAQQGAPEGTAVVADQQTQGRGRLGRDWWSPPGAGLYLSMVVRPGVNDSVAPISLAAGVSVARAVQRLTALPVELKWPNDLVIGRPWRKLAGVLCEASQLGTTSAAVVVGIGVNLRRSAYPPAIADRATSIAEECTQEIDRDVLARACHEELGAAINQMRSGAMVYILEQWQAFGRVALDCAPVRWRTVDGEHRGTTAGLDEDGALLVRAMGASTVDRVVAGEVIWEMLTRD